MKRTCAIIALALCPTLTVGQQAVWEPVFDWGNDPQGADASVAVDLIHFWDGETARFLSLTYELSSSATFCPSATSDLARVWTPPAIGDPPGSPGTFDAAPLCRTYEFCGGHATLADGRILHVGGYYIDHANLFTPWEAAQGYWNVPDPFGPAVPPANMDERRWYPTATTLPDGRVLVSSGWRCDPSSPTCSDQWVTVAEIYDPTTSSFASIPDSYQQRLYPFMFVLPDGDLIDAGSGATRMLDSSTWMWGDFVDPPSWPSPPPPASGYTGSAVMYEPGKIMRCGGYNFSIADVVDTTWVYDHDDSAWMVAGEMKIARRHHDLVILPDGRVLAVGGTQDGSFGDPVFAAELWDPASGQWTLQPESDNSQGRGYHATAVLLPDGRVVSAGQNGSRTGQMFRPAYMDEGVPRPTILDAPEYMEWGEEYQIDYELDVENGGGVAKKAALIRLASVTHSFDQSQRYVPLTITEWDPTDGPQQYIKVDAPPNGNYAPPGMYMLFILDEYAHNQFSPCTMAAYVLVGG